MKTVISSLSAVLIALVSQQFSLAYPEYAQPELISAPSLITGGTANNIALKRLPIPELTPDITLSEDFLLFKKIFEEIKHNYVDEISDEALIKNAITGMLSNLDPHSTYYSAEDFERIQTQTSGTFAGIGIELNASHKEVGLAITKVFKNSPASGADLQIGDLITHIDGQAVIDLEYKKALTLLQGKVGSSVTLSLLRQGMPLEVTIIRDTIKTPSLSQSMLYNNEFAYILLDRFQKESDQEIINALAELRIEAESQNTQIRGVILDLRDNNGGLLSASAEVADLFIREGLITYTDGQAEKHQNRYIATDGDILEGLPLIILINAQSASGAEIVAGALQDHARAVIIGENSYGKGSVQYAVGLTNGQAIRYTVARYYTPKGRAIQSHGITPDIIIPSIKASVVKNVQPQREINRPGHLENPQTTTESARAPANFSSMLKDDYVLYESLNIMRAITAFPHNKP